MLRAERLRADAAQERIAPAGTLPDPQLSFGLMNRPIAGFGTAEPMTMNSVQLSQTFPWPGKLGFSAERARGLADAEQLDAAEAELELGARVTDVYYRIAYMDRAVAVMDDTRALLRTFLDVSTAMYGVGTALQQDVLEAQVAVARMTEDITVMRQDRAATAARLNALLGRDATAPIAALEFGSTPTDSLPSVDSLLQRAVTRRPALASAAARVRAAEAGVRAAQREFYPDLMVGVAYAQRPQFDDMISLMIGISLPLRTGSRQRPMQREAQAMQAMEEARARDLWSETYARLAELRAAAERARQLTALYAASILPQARAAVQSALSAYRVGRVPYMTLVENQMTVNRYAIESLRLVADYRGTVAEIASLVGGALGGER
jgi:outer membrane protein TolC